jgi:hypothetical protein
MNNSDSFKEFLSSKEMDNIMKMFSSMDPSLIVSVFNGMKDSLTEEQRKTIDNLMKSMTQAILEEGSKRK